jgi:Lrp/AsnC family leucine-responsive transcriptional regulator
MARGTFAQRAKPLAGLLDGRAGTAGALQLADHRSGPFNSHSDMQLLAPTRIRRSSNDKIDHRILHVLQNDGRISNLKLAERVNLSPSAVLERVKRLRREGYILGFQARLSREKLGMEVLAFVEVELERMDSSVMQQFEAAVRQRSAILECHMIAGSFDYLLKVLVTDMPACREFVASEIACLPGVREARVHAGVELAEPGTGGGAGDARIDDIDINLLRLLQADGRLSVARLADELGVAAAIVRDRLGRLNRRGFILGYVAVLDETKLRSGQIVFAAVSTTQSAAGVGHALKQAAQAGGEIVECHQVVGQFDYLLKTRVADMGRYHELIESAVWTLPGVRQVRHHAAMGEIKNTGRIPL